MKFRKRPVVIEAVQLTESNIVEVRAFCPRLVAWSQSGNGAITYATILTPEGVMEAKPGDWIVRGIKGEFYPCTPDTFAQNYERVDEEACRG